MKLKTAASSKIRPSAHSSVSSSWILTPERAIAVAREDDVVRALLVVAPVNHVEEEPGVFFVEVATPNLINDETGRPHEIRDRSRRFLRPPSVGELVPQFGYLFMKYVFRPCLQHSCPNACARCALPVLGGPMNARFRCAYFCPSSKISSCPHVSSRSSFEADFEVESSGRKSAHAYSRVLYPEQAPPFLAHPRSVLLGRRGLRDRAAL